MRIEELAADVLDRARTVKESQVTRALEDGNDDRDISAIVEAIRGEHPVAVISVHQHERDIILNCCSVAAGSFDADVIAMTHEGYQGLGTFIQSGAINPLTGRDWEAGEMNDVVANHQGIEKGWVTECLDVLVVNRAGDAAQVSQGFYYEGTELRWRKAGRVFSTLDPNLKPGGLMIEALQSFMLRPSISQVAPGISAGMPQEERDYIAAMFLDQEAGCSVFLLADPQDTERVEFLNRHGVGYKRVDLTDFTDE